MVGGGERNQCDCTNRRFQDLRPYVPSTRQEHDPITVVKPQVPLESISERKREY